MQEREQDAAASGQARGPGREQVTGSGFPPRRILLGNNCVYIRVTERYTVDE